MPFDPQLVEAQLALNRIGTTDMPKLAWDALEAGVDGPATRRLAALHFPTFFQVREILPKVLEEWHLKQIPKAEAALRLAKRRAREILQSNDDPLKHANDFFHLCVEANFCKELSDYENWTTRFTSPAIPAKPTTKSALAPRKTKSPRRKMRGTRKGRQSVKARPASRTNYFVAATRGLIRIFNSK